MWRCLLLQEVPRLEEVEEVEGGVLEEPPPARGCCSYQECVKLSLGYTGLGATVI